MQKVTANMTVARLWKNKECISMQNFSDEVSCKISTLKTKKMIGQVRDNLDT